jgi:putative hemolysin
MEPSKPPRLGSLPALSFLTLAVTIGLCSLAAPLFADPAVTTATVPHSEPAHQTLNLAIYLPIVFLLVFINGFFVASEFALVAVRKTRIDQLAAEGSSSAKVVQTAIKDLDRYIAATQVGITVASLLLGGIGERTFHQLFEPWLAWVPAGLPAGLTGSVIAFGLAYFVMTALHVVIGELMPKSLALQFAEQVTLLIGRPMLFVTKLFAPLIWMLNGTGNFLLRRLGVHPVEGHGTVHSPEELDLLVAQSHQGGELNDTEAEILHRVVRFSDLTVREVMVPRVEMQALPVEMPVLALRAWVHSKPHSRVPVYHGTMDEVIGAAHLKDIVPFVARLDQKANYDSNEGEKMVSLLPIVRDMVRVPETTTIDKLLIQFKRRRQQMAIVIDEFGGTAGIVTLGDLLEQVFGEVADEFDIEEDEIKHDGTRIFIPGRTLIETINSRYETGFRQDEADTVAGLILTALGRPANVGDMVEINDCQLRVEAVERLRITKVSLVLPVEKD